jgi:ABC-type Fe3+-hydroxamate transport system substrate-binding protein
LLNDLIELSGGRNIVTNENSSILVSIEHLMQADPDVILFVNEFATTNSIIQRSGWNELSAVRKGRVFSIDRSCLIAGAGLPEAAIKLRALLSTIKLVEK